jgi:hypothetical protein
MLSQRAPETLPSLEFIGKILAVQYANKIDRFDLRPFLYPGMYDNYAFKKIDEMVEKIEAFKAKQVE